MTPEAESRIIRDWRRRRASGEPGFWRDLMVALNVNASPERAAELLARVGSGDERACDPV